MKRYFGLLCLTVATLTLLSSCLKGKDDDAAQAIYNDMAISAFSLGTLNHYLHTTSSTGADSIYKVALSGSSYNFVIDQVGRRIFNPDSLPIGTDVAHVVCTLTTYNNGVALLESTTNADSLIYYSSSDSIDFSVPRKVRVYAYGSNLYSTYTISVNVHKQEANELNWNQMAALTDKAQAAFDDARCSQYQAAAEAAGMRLTGHSSTELYALSSDNQLMLSKDMGQTWTADALDSSPSLLPTEDIASVTIPYSSYYENIDYVLMAGSRSATDYPQEQCAQLWYKIVDYSETGYASKWSYINVSENDKSILPRLSHLSLISYNGSILAFGKNGSTLKIYESKDKGLTWNESSNYTLPSGLDTSGDIDVVVDSDNYIWLVQPSSGQIWRGLMNSMSWQ